MTLTLYQSDGTTPLDTDTFDSLQAGDYSAELTFILANEGVSDYSNILLSIEAEDPDTAGSYLLEGVAPQDQLWGSIKATGQDTSGDASQAAFLTDWQPWGAHRMLLVPTLLAGNSRTFKARQRPPASAAAASWKWAISIRLAENSVALPSGISETLHGIITGVGDRTKSGVISGGAVTATGTPDDEVHVAAVEYLFDGVVYRTGSTTDVTLSQDDGDAATLGSGESYIAVLSLDETGVVATKGSKGASPSTPAVPSGNLSLGIVVSVGYDAGGSTIQTSDITGSTTYDRFLVTAGTGLEALVHAGQALAGGTYRFSATQTAVALTSSSTNRIWQLADGTYDTSTDETPPTSTSMLLADAVTDGSSVTAIIDRRRYADRAPQDAGTAATNVRAQEYGDSRIHQTVLTVTNAVLPAITGGAAQAVGVALYDWPPGAIVQESVHGSLAIQQQDGNIDADTPDVGLGTTIATGAVSVLSGTPAFEDVLTGQTAADCDGTPTVKTVADQVLVIETGDSHTLYANFADTWAASGDAGALVSGTVVINWRRME